MGLSLPAFMAGKSHGAERVEQVDDRTNISNHSLHVSSDFAVEANEALETCEPSTPNALQGVSDSTDDTNGLQPLVSKQMTNGAPLPETNPDATMDTDKQDRRQSIFDRLTARKDSLFDVIQGPWALPWKKTEKKSKGKEVDGEVHPGLVEDREREKEKDENEKEKDKEKERAKEGHGRSMSDKLPLPLTLGKFWRGARRRSTGSEDADGLEARKEKVEKGGLSKSELKRTRTQSLKPGKVDKGMGEVKVPTKANSISVPAADEKQTLKPSTTHPSTVPTSNTEAAVGLSRTSSRASNSDSKSLKEMLRAQTQLMKRLDAEARGPKVLRRVTGDVGMGKSKIGESSVAGAEGRYGAESGMGRGGLGVRRSMCDVDGPMIRSDVELGAGTRHFSTSVLPSSTTSTAHGLKERRSVLEMRTTSAVESEERNGVTPGPGNTTGILQRVNSSAAELVNPNESGRECATTPVLHWQDDPEEWMSYAKRVARYMNPDTPERGSPNGSPQISPRGSSRRRGSGSSTPRTLRLPASSLSLGPGIERVERKPVQISGDAPMEWSAGLGRPGTALTFDNDNGNEEGERDGEGEAEAEGEGQGEEFTDANERELSVSSALLPTGILRPPPPPPSAPSAPQGSAASPPALPTTFSTSPSASFSLPRPVSPSQYSLASTRLSLDNITVNSGSGIDTRVRPALTPWPTQESVGSMYAPEVRVGVREVRAGEA